MGFYIDELTRWDHGKQLTCHLTSEDHSEDGIRALIRFAMQIGFSGKTIQAQKRNLDHFLYPHFVLTPRFRRYARNHGAIELTNNELVWLCARESLRPKITAAPLAADPPEAPLIDREDMHTRLSAAITVLRGHIS